MRNKTLQPWLWGIAIVLLIVGIIYWYATHPKPGQTVADLGNRHLATQNEPHEPYNSNPPTSGPHFSTAPWGITKEQIPDEIQLHNLEDGGVIVHYDPVKVDATTTQQLTDIVQPLYVKSQKVILEPYANMESPIALTAWTRIDRLQSVDRAEIEKFVSAFVGVDHHVGGGG